LGGCFGVVGLGLAVIFGGGAEEVLCFG